MRIRTNENGDSFSFFVILFFLCILGAVAYEAKTIIDRRSAPTHLDGPYYAYGHVTEYHETADGLAEFTVVVDGTVYEAEEAVYLPRVPIKPGWYQVNVALAKGGVIEVITESDGSCAVGFIERERAAGWLE
jgi:hypothetical protein